MLLDVLLLDIETAPGLAYFWRPTDQYIPMDMVVRPGFLLGFGAKWRGQRGFTSHFVSEHEAPEGDDYQIVEHVASMIRTADVVVGHNIDRFDLPQINNRVLYYELEPLGPVRTIDTLKLAKANLDLPWNKLDFLGEYLGVGRKLKTDMDLWKSCLDGRGDALKRMARYNKQDVILLEKVLDRMMPYVRNLRRLVDGDGDGVPTCPTCGSHNLMRRGFDRTQVSTWVKLQCQDCQRYTREPAALKSKKLGVTPL